MSVTNQKNQKDQKDLKELKAAEIAEVSGGKKCCPKKTKKGSPLRRPDYTRDGDMARF